MARRKSKRGPLDYAKSPWLIGFGLITFILLYAPIAQLIAFSFNDSKRNIVWRGFTTKYYAKAWNDPALVEAFVNSITIAVMCTMVATIIGTATALWLWRFRFPAKSAAEGVMALPIVIPEICMGVAVLVMYSRFGSWMRGVETGPLHWLNEFWAIWPPLNLDAFTIARIWNEFFSVWPLNLGAITAAHIAFSFPFVAVVVRARLAGFNREFEEASKDLGASEWQTFWNVVLPFMMPGVIAGALLSFTLSLDDFVITFFTAGPETNTFPVKVYSLVRRGVSPDINAASTVLIVITLVATIIAMRMQAPSKTEG